MRVGWIVPGFSGDEADWCIPALLDLAREIAPRCDLHIVALHYPFRRDVYRVYGATVHSLGGASRGGVHTPLVWREAVRVIQSLQPDVLHAFWAYEPGVIAAWLAARIPAIVHLAGGELIDLPEIGYGLRGRRHARWLMRWALNRARLVTAGSRYLMDLAADFTGGREIAFAPLGVDRALFQPRRAPPSQVVLLSVASLEPVKDQARLLRAFKRVSDSAPDARLVVAGRGQLADELRALSDQLGVSARVTFTGEIPHERLPDLYRTAAVFVQSSRHEAQGMAALEAAACGVPLIGTAVGVIADLAPGAAIATPVGDDVSLAQAISGVLRDPARRAQLSRAAGIAIEQTYVLTRAVDRAMMMYEMLMSEH